MGKYIKAGVRRVSGKGRRRTKSTEVIGDEAAVKAKAESVQAIADARQEDPTQVADAIRGNFLSLFESTSLSGLRSR